MPEPLQANGPSVKKNELVATELGSGSVPPHLSDGPPVGCWWDIDVVVIVSNLVTATVALSCFSVGKLKLIMPRYT